MTVTCSRTSIDQQRRQRLQRQNVRPDRPLDRSPPGVDRDRPERRAERHRSVVAPEIKDEHVDVALVACDTGSESRNRGRIVDSAGRLRAYD